MIRPSGLADYAWCAFIDGWPVSNRRRGAPGGFPALDQAIGRCKIVIDIEAPARRWRVMQRLFRKLRTSVNKTLTGDRRATQRRIPDLPFSPAAANSATARRQAHPGRNQRDRLSDSPIHAIPAPSATASVIPSPASSPFGARHDQVAADQHM